MSDETTRQDGLHPRDLLFHLREWLNRHWKTNAKHFGDSDQSGHPHGYTGVVIPDWDLRQRLDEIDQSLAIPSPDEAQPAPVRTLVPEDPSKERRQTSPFPPAPAPRDACQLCNGFRGGIPGNENIEEGITMCDYCHATIIQFRRERLKLNANSTVLKKEHQAPQAASPAPEGEPPCVAWLRAQLKNVSVAYESHINEVLAHIDRLTAENAALKGLLLRARPHIPRYFLGCLADSIDAALFPQTAQPDPDEHAGGNDGFTGWICGNNYRRRGRLDTCVGKTDREPWYIADDGMRWSSYDVTFRPDPPKAQEGKP